MGGTDYVTVPDHADLSFGDGSTDSAFSIAAWIYVTGHTSWQTIVSKYQTSSGAEWLFRLDSDEKLRFTLHDNSAPAKRGQVTNDALSAGWHFVAGTYDGDQTNAAEGVSLYVDGVVVSSTAISIGTYTAMESLGANMAIGARYTSVPAPTDYFQDKIDNVMIFDRALSPKETRRIYRTGMGDPNCHLLPISPCIDAGDNTAVPSGVTTDLDGNPRILDGDNDGTATVDMGAYELMYVEGTLDLDENATLIPNGGSGIPTEDAQVVIENTSGPDGATVTVTQYDTDLHKGEHTYNVMGTTLVVETSLLDGEFFATIIVPFTAADLNGADWWDLDLQYWNGSSWELAVLGNTQNSPGYGGPEGDRFEVEDTVIPMLSSELGDYGVFWNPNEGKGFVWANVDHTTDFAAVTGEDTIALELSVSVEPAVLWPANHKMVLITPSWTVSDKCDTTPEVSLVSITVNEADDAKGSGHTTDDIQIGDDGSIYLRAERSGKGRDKVYTITYKAVDDCGNATESSATVTVPHDKR
jgi:hypothetical protein